MSMIYKEGNTIYKETYISVYGYPFMCLFQTFVSGEFTLVRF